MTSRDFCYWLQGFFEVGDPATLDAKQTDLVKRHLALVFKHEIDPSAGPPEHQDELNKIHQDLSGLVEKMGGQEKLCEKLEKDVKEAKKIAQSAASKPSGNPVFRC